MGVRLLQSFMERGMKNGIKEVDMQKEVDEYKRQHNGDEPLIIIDLLALNSLIFTNKHEIILGGRYNIYNDRATVVFNRLKSLGCTLVFFTDGPPREEKIPTCLSRRNENYRKAMEALRCVYSKSDLTVCLQGIDLQSPTPMFSTFRNLASPFGHVFISVLNECDIEIADYATKHNALAVISNDTDFLIFNGNWKYWSARVLDVNNLKTIEYDRTALRRTLQLSSDQMPLLATMSGNDYVTFDSLKNFHRSVKEKQRYKYHSDRRNHFKGNDRYQFIAVASEIRSLGVESTTISNKQAANVASRIFGKLDQKTGIDIIQSSLKSYDYSKMTRKYDSEFIRHVSQYEGRMNYILLANIKYIVQLNHFDLSKSDFKSFFEIISPLLRRIMGIVLNQEVNATRTFYCKFSHNEEYQLTDLQAEYPQCNVPPLQTLFFQKRGKNPKLDNVRLELICWQVSSKLNPEIIKSLQSINVANAITLLYLVELQQINEDEADCLLLACNCPDDIRDSLDLNDMNRINERDARIAFLFTIVQVYIRNCLYAVGWDEFCPLIMFDGLYFHYLRQKWTRLDRDSMLKSYQNLRLYAKAERLIKHGIRLITMGVRLLQTYMERYVRCGVVDVDLKVEVDKFKSENGGEEPLIVIDLISMYHLFYTSNHELILGARFNVYNERVVDLLSRIKSLGVKLVFFTDGPARDEKLETCLKRRNNDYRKAIEALNLVYSGADLYEEMEKIEVATPFFGNFKSLAKQFGDVHVAAQNECDVELAEYATRNNALAIISNDTDFLIFPGNWRYWSSRYFNVFRLTIAEFNREALRQTLGLKPDQMAILATMSGNDIVPYDDVKAYHRSIKHYHNGLHFRALASKIQSLRLSLGSISDEQVKLIADLIFARPNQELGRKLVAISLKSYDYMNLNTNECIGLLSRLAKGGGKFNLKILANCKNIIQPHHFDFSKRDLKPFFEIISPLIRRVMGILLKTEGENISRIFYSKIEHEKEYEEIVLEPDFPPYDLPPLENLLLDEVGTNAQLDKTRIELICWQISPKLTPALFESLCHVNVANAVTLLYLIELGQITIDEADCLLLACNCPSNIRDSLCLSDMRLINERDARIAFLFKSVRVYIKNCFDAVGWKKFDKFVRFDGLYFHTLRKTWNGVNKSELMEPYDTLRVYGRL